MQSVGFTRLIALEFSMFWYAAKNRGQKWTVHPFVCVLNVLFFLSHWLYNPAFFFDMILRFVRAGQKSKVQLQRYRFWIFLSFSSFHSVTVNTILFFVFCVLEYFKRGVYWPDLLNWNIKVLFLEADNACFYPDPLLVDMLFCISHGTYRNDPKTTANSSASRVYFLRSRASTHARTRTHTHTLSLSLSLSHSLVGIPVK
jgi:hypothetical protein